ncbi:phosphatase PAP2 family protein [Miltoncostaea marina]|uniref:phosphatase PAP2 family protein n=1 Tax=Miltoncostaea marina TaxID=2843215 RepID=UPI001C3CE80D|nr:phosphatase PAP2 family protein [Miltoncostaea marina]
MAAAELLVAIDRAVLEAVVALRADAVTPVVVALSAWWVKALLIPAVGVTGALAMARRAGRGPAAAARAAGAVVVCAALAHGLASAASWGLKDAFDRARPPLGDGAITALVALPADASMPSGHATTAFATAGVVALLHPRLRWPALALALAALVALSRVYLGVHHPLDVAVGALVGLVIALVVVAAWRRLAAALVRGRFGRGRGGESSGRWTSRPST